jgi:hypothetical protein
MPVNEQPFLHTVDANADPVADRKATTTAAASKN